MGGRSRGEGLAGGNEGLRKTEPTCSRVQVDNFESFFDQVDSRKKALPLDPVDI